MVVRLTLGHTAWELVPVAAAAPPQPWAGTPQVVTLVERERRDAVLAQAERLGFHVNPHEVVEAAAHSVDRTWVRRLAGFVDLPEDLHLTGYGPDLEVFVWDGRKVRLHAGARVELSWPVEARVAATGCPLRSGADSSCRPHGGPWGGAAIQAPGVWDRARHELVDALACGVCGGAQPDFRRPEED